MESVAEWPVERKLEEALRRSLPRLGPAARAQVEALLTPEALATIAAVLVAWIVSHAFGIGEVIDIIILGAGALAIGMAVLEGADHLYQFAVRACRASSSSDLDASGAHFATAVGILGIRQCSPSYFGEHRRLIAEAFPAGRVPSRLVEWRTARLSVGPSTNRGWEASGGGKAGRTAGAISWSPPVGQRELASSCFFTNEFTNSSRRSFIRCGTSASRIEMLRIATPR